MSNLGSKCIAAILLSMENNLPKGWIEVELNELVSYRKGKKPKTLSPNEFKYSIPYLNIKAIEKNIIDEYADIESSNISNGDEIFVVWDGARSGWVAKGMKGAIGSTLMAMKPYLLNTDFLFRFLQTQFDNINSNPRGTGIPHVDPELFWNVQVPLAPLPEQQRIVEKLDTLMSRITNSKTRLVKIPTLLKNFRQSVLAAAVSGELTSEWRKENKIDSSEIQIEEIKVKRNKLFKEQKKWSKSKKTESIESDYMSFMNELPDSWKLVKWEDVGLSQNGKSFSSKLYQDQGLKLLRPGNLHVKGNLEWNSSNTKCLPLKFASESPEYIVEECEIVMNLTAQSLKDEFLGRVCFTSEKERCLLNQRLARIYPVDFDRKYFFWVLKSKLFRKFVDDLNTGTLIQHMFTSQLDQFQFPFPPVEEQKEIVRKVEELFHYADTIEARYNKAKTWFDKLPQAILAKAFRGELVTQNENDEPASVLLGRIKQKKQNTNNPKLVAKQKKMYEKND